MCQAIQALLPARLQTFYAKMFLAKNFAMDEEPALKAFARAFPGLLENPVQLFVKLGACPAIQLIALNANKGLNSLMGTVVSVLVAVKSVKAPKVVISVLGGFI